jgi:hypothetical protein
VIPDEGVAQLFNLRSRLIVTGILLCLALGATIFCAVQTVQAIQRFQQARSLSAEGDVSTIQPWMTIHYVSRVYYVPESYLDEQLKIKDPNSIRHVPLRSLAVRYNRSIDGLIRDIQTAIKTYRKQHPLRHSFTNLHANQLLALEGGMT